MELSTNNITHFQGSLLEWYQNFGRQHLPWKQPASVYRVLVSELMLQQTQVQTVLPYFERFMTALPTLEALAEASEDKVLSLWTGLGYYSRARYLHKTAKMLVASQSTPTTVKEWMQYPGVGQSTAGAILAQAQTISAPIMEGNVKRILSRLFELDAWPGNPKVQKQLWEWATQLTPDDQTVADYTQAIMDLGATLCTKGSPDCEACPVNDHCRAYAHGTVDTYPHPKPKKDIPAATWHLLAVMGPGEPASIWLEKRPEQGIWGNLWSVPVFEGSEQDLLTTLATQLPKTVPTEVFERRHALTHYRLTLKLHCVTLNRKRKLSPFCHEQGQWVCLSNLADLGMPRPLCQLLSTATKGLTHA